MGGHTYLEQIDRLTADWLPNDKKNPRLEAALKGEKFYVSGPCKTHGPGVKRYVSCNSCVECARDLAARRRNNKEKAAMDAAVKRVYLDTNRNEINAKKRIRYYFDSEFREAYLARRKQAYYLKAAERALLSFDPVI